MSRTPYLDTPIANGRVHPVETDDDLAAARDQLHSPGLLAVDVESTGIGWHDTLTTVQFGNETDAFVFNPHQFPELVRTLLHRKDDRGLLAHNAPFDAQKLATFTGHKVVDVLWNIQDTSVLSRLVDSRSRKQGGLGHALKDLSAAYVDPNANVGEHELTDHFTSLGYNKNTGWAHMDMTHQVFVRYAGLDCLLTARLFPILKDIVKDKGLEHLAAFDLEIQRIVSSMRERGFRVDTDYATALSADLEDEYEGHRVAASALGVSNVRSTRQVADALLLRGHELTERTNSGEWKVDKVVLGGIDSDVARAVLGAKAANKAQKSWVEPIIEAGLGDGRVHPTINPSNAVTYRMSISNPGLHQLPSDDYRIRSCLTADPGQTLISCDFSQIELRVVAALAREQSMIDVFASGGDIHSATAARLFGDDFTPRQRGLAKNTAFGVVFQGGPRTLARQAGITEGEARMTIDNFYRQFPGLKRWSGDVIDYIKERRPCVVTYTGRQINLSPQFAYRAVNYQVQSLAGDVFKQSLINLAKAGLEEHLLLPVHDEVVAQAPQEEAAEVANEIAKVMTDDLDGVPLTAEAEVIGFRWGDKYVPEPEVAHAH